MFKNNKGFTLIEMLVVLLIISVLIILIVPNLSRQSQSVHEKGCDALVAVVQAQVDLYTIDKGFPPSDLSDLVDQYLSADQLYCEDGKEFTLEGGKVNRPND